MPEVATTVFHGTTKSRAVKIKRTGFRSSDKPTEWLGFGVYFFDRRRDAENWAKSECRRSRASFHERPAILDSKIKCDSTAFFDLDSRPNMDKLIDELDPILKEMGKSGEGAIQFSEKNEVKCFCCNYYKRTHGMKIMAYSFPALRVNRAGFDFCSKQRQYCVSDNCCITDINIKEVADYEKQL